jgi:hypothetical protein
MTIPRAPKTRFLGDDFWDSVEDRDLVYFCLNVGDADAQVLLLPNVETSREDAAGNPVKRRPVIVVDAGTSSKATKFLEALGTASNGKVPPIEWIDVVVATHPHGDHIGGMPRLLEEFEGRIGEFWDPGYFHPSGTYFKVMERLARMTDTVYVQPAAGMRRFIGDVEVTVLTPSVALRNRYDTYGIDVNNASISLRVATPAGRAKFVPGDSWQLLEGVDERAQFSLILGADAQTESWAHAMADFPDLMKSQSEAAKAIGAATNDRDFLDADVLKVSHHGSKKGVNYELVDRIAPKFLLLSCSDRSGHGFPHGLNQHILREAKEKLAKSGAVHRPDDDHLRGVFYTAQKDTADVLLGSIAIVGSSNSDIEMWRFGDSTRNLPAFDRARRWLAKEVD